MNRYRMPFSEAVKIARSLSIKTRKEWRQLASAGKIPEALPRHPDGIYKKQGWQGWRYWLGTDKEEATYGNSKINTQIFERPSESKRSQGTVWPGPDPYKHPSL